MANENDLYDNWDLESYNKAYGNAGKNERWPGENEYYQNTDQQGNYRPPGSFLRSGIGSFYNTPQAPEAPVYPGSAYSPHREFDEMQFSERVQPPAKKGFIRNILDNTIMGKIAAGTDATNPNAFNYNKNLQGQIDYMKDQGMYGVDPSSGLSKITSGVLRGKNLQSGFGTNDLGKMLSKQLGKYEKTYGNLEKQWGSTLRRRTDDEEGYQAALKAKKERYFKQFIEPARIEQENQIAAQKKATEDAIAAQRATTAQADRAAGSHRDTVQLDPRGGGGPGGGTWHGQTAAKERQGVQVSGPGFGKGSYFNQGGRAGYQGGELVTDESMMEATPAGFMQENVEEVQGEPSREQLEALAMEIFQLPLEELNEEQLMVVYQAAMQQEPMQENIQEEDVQFAAQGGRAGYRFGRDVEQQTDFLEGPRDDLMASGTSLDDGRNELALQLFGKELHLLTEEEMEILNDEADRLTSKFMGAQGGLAGLL